MTTGGACADAACDGDMHYTGQRDPLTNEDIEAGPCPRWDDTGAATVAIFLLGVIASAFALLALLAAGQHVMCQLHDQQVRYCDGYDGSGGNQ